MNHKHDHDRSGIERRRNPQSLPEPSVTSIVALILIIFFMGLGLGGISGRTRAPVEAHEAAAPSPYTHTNPSCAKP